MLCTLRYFVDYWNDYWVLIVFLFGIEYLNAYLIPSVIQKMKDLAERPPSSLSVTTLVLLLVVLSFSMNACEYALAQRKAEEAATFAESMKTLVKTAEGMVAVPSDNLVVGYYISTGSERVVSLDELEPLSDNVLYYIRNGLFAREGRKFIEKDLMDYYRQFSWYKPYIRPSDFEWDMLSDCQKETVLNIKAIEDHRKQK